MPTFGSLSIDRWILDALRVNKLVVFGGAGVSAGSPSLLPNFEDLAKFISNGTGVSRVEKEPIDKFLGRLQHKGVSIHARAARHLNRPGSLPNALHQDLLRLFGSAERVRLVTTNFDLHFEAAAHELFQVGVDTFTAPALPLGSQFHGIIHVHGALTRPPEMVLSDADFGRAYLTEGWARRFLVDVFHHYTVLFVGYSHTDVVLNYLARALPASSDAKRFALTEDEGDWNLLGITPIRFSKTTEENPYSELYLGVKSLADRSVRRAIDWQSLLSEIARGVPPTDEASIGEIDHALREIHTTRFFTNVARDRGWPSWLSSRNHIDSLFCPGELDERAQLLSTWLAEHYTREHATELFALIAEHQMQLNPYLWWAIGRELSVVKDRDIHLLTLQQWVVTLIACAPPNSDRHIHKWLADRCGEMGLHHLSLKLFLVMCGHRLRIKQYSSWRTSGDVQPEKQFNLECNITAEHWGLNEVWKKNLQPYLTELAPSLLSGIIHQIEILHNDNLAWGNASREFDTISYGRSAIEPHEQDKYPQAIDVLIDSARDSLEWLAVNDPRLLDAWIERLITSDVPLHRRLAIHAMNAHLKWTADEKIEWFVNRSGLSNLNEHHEIRRAVAAIFPVAGSTRKQLILSEILGHVLPAIDDWSSEDRTALWRFEWLDWLCKADPNCSLVAAALAQILLANPELRPREHTDFTHFSTIGFHSPKSPWPPTELLSKAPIDQLSDLLVFQAGRFEEPSREGLLSAILEACKQGPDWGLQLSDALCSHSNWNSDLWSPLIRSWQEPTITFEAWSTILHTVRRQELIAVHTYDVANLIYALVRNDGKTFTLQLLDQANEIALATWQIIEPIENDEVVISWDSAAINHPAGFIVEFWIDGLSLYLRDKTGPDRALPSTYRDWFTMVVNDISQKGGMGRCLLAGQVGFLFDLDERWATQHLLPLFRSRDERVFAQAWEGLLVWGRLYPALVTALKPAFSEAIERFGTDLTDQRSRFIEFIAALFIFHLEDPTQDLLPKLIQHCTVADRIGFTNHLGHFLRQMPFESIEQLWTRWLSQYWSNRIQAVPAQLDDEEIRGMLDWLPQMGDLFPAAVSLTIASPPCPLNDCHFLWDLKTSDLVTRFPIETANLLIHICSSELGYHVEDIKVIAARMSGLPDSLKQDLDECLARIGVILSH